MSNESYDNSAIPQSNPYDGTAEAYESFDSEQNLESALNERAEANEIREKIAELEGSESEFESEENAEVEESKDDFSSKFAALSRREKQLRERESQLQSQYESKLAELEQKILALQSPQEPEITEEPKLPLEYRLKKDPLGTLNELGLSYDKLTNLALNDGKLTTDMQMELMRSEIEDKYSRQIDELRNELTERDKRLEEEKYNETVNNFKTEITNFVNDNDKYELIRANDAADVVFDVIEQHYSETGRILSKEEASDMVESHLEQEVEKLLKLNKLKSKLGMQEASKKVVSPTPNQTQKAPTLSNAHSVTASNSSRPKSREESVASAASILKWID